MLHTEEAPQGTRLVVDTLSCLIAKEADPSRIMAQVRYLNCSAGLDIHGYMHCDRRFAWCSALWIKSSLPLALVA